jgi:hypothetical protein
MTSTESSPVTTGDQRVPTTKGITSEERFNSKWDTQGPAFNAWHRNVELFAKIVQQNPGLWLVDSDLKYLNIRLDTRTGTFLVSCRDGEAISADRVVDAARKARSQGLNVAYADLTKDAAEVSDHQRGAEAGGDDQRSGLSPIPSPDAAKGGAA